MDEQEFWAIIGMLDWSETGDDDAVMKPAIDALSQKSDEEISQFYEIMARLLYEIDGLAWAENMGDAPIVDGDPYYSPDGFLYARCCVIANGENFYNEVKEDPSQMPRGMEFESLLYLCDRAWERKHGEEPDYEEFFCEPEYEFETFTNEDQWN